MVRSGGVVNTENMTHFKIRYWEGNVGLTVANVTSVPFRTLPDENDDTGYGYGSEAGVQQLLADGQIGEAFPGGGWRNQLWWDGVPLVADSSRQALRPWEEAFDVRPLSLTSPHAHFPAPRVVPTCHKGSPCVVCIDRMQLPAARDDAAGSRGNNTRKDSRRGFVVLWRCCTPRKQPSSQPDCLTVLCIHIHQSTRLYD
jgi:hypothetical protein